MNYTKSELDAIVLDSFDELTYKVKLHVTEGFRYSAPCKNTPIF